MVSSTTGRAPQRCWLCWFLLVYVNVTRNFYQPLIGIQRNPTDIVLLNQQKTIVWAPIASVASVASVAIDIPIVLELQSCLHHRPHDPRWPPIHSAGLQQRPDARRARDARRWADVGPENYRHRGPEVGFRNPRGPVARCGNEASGELCSNLRRKWMKTRWKWFVFLDDLPWLYLNPWGNCS